MPMTVEQARKEITELEVKLKEHAALMNRKMLLEQFLMLAERLDTSTAKHVNQPQPISNVAKPNTSAAALEVLRKQGPLHLRKLLEKMQQIGWTGDSADAKKREKALYVYLHRNGQLFENVGNNVWKVRTAETKAAS
jgi:hypothetical protein